MATWDGRRRPNRRWKEPPSGERSWWYGFDDESQYYPYRSAGIAAFMSLPPAHWGVRQDQDRVEKALSGAWSTRTTTGSETPRRRDTTSARELARAAGRLAICVVEKRNGKQSLPKGGRKPGETLEQNARREWREEAGLSEARLQLLPAEAEEGRPRCEEQQIGAFYFVAACREPRPGDIDEFPEVRRPPEQSTLSHPLPTWAPPEEDGEDKDPIVKAYWVRVDQVLLGAFDLPRWRRDLVRLALEQFLERQGLELLDLPGGVSSYLLVDKEELEEEKKSPGGPGPGGEEGTETEKLLGLCGVENPPRRWGVVEDSKGRSVVPTASASGSSRTKPRWRRRTRGGDDSGTHDGKLLPTQRSEGREGGVDAEVATTKEGATTRE